jgi:CO/xanthine dehydrogenase Mo-binding subunit
MPVSRRNFIQQMGFVTIGFSLIGAHCMGEVETASRLLQRPDGSSPDANKINAWLQILENGHIRILTGKMELGQGIEIAVRQIAAEELNTRLEMISVNLAETGITPDEGYTAGSRSIESSGMAIRNAAASARETILELAARKWGPSITPLELKDGMLIGPDQKLSLYDLLEGRQLTKPVTKPSKYLGKTTRKFVGKPIPRDEIEAMVRGSYTYVQDLRFPRMVHARVIRPAGYQATLVSVDESKLRQHPGFLKIVRKGNFLGVLAEKEYQAVQLKELAAGATVWASNEQLPKTGDLRTFIKNLPAGIETHEDKGDLNAAMQGPGIKHKAGYFKPYIMHASTGPSCAVAVFENDQLSIWTHSQGVYPLRKTLSALLELPEDAIHIKGVPGSGCYGHNGADDAAAEAALMAMAFPGRHVRLQWTREDEHGWEPYGTAMAIELRAALDSNGMIQGWQYDLWSDGHSTRPDGNPDNLLPARYLDQGHGAPSIGFKGGAVRNSLPYYSLPNIKVQLHSFKGPLRASSLRGLGAYANIFAIESFMDELAFKAKIDPLSFRLQHLEDERARTCLEHLKSNTSGLSLKAGEGLGYAFSRYKNSAAYCAVAAQVSALGEKGEVRVVKMWAVIDAGETINPDGLKNQTEGGMIQSASWALKEQVLFDRQHITSLDWNTYPILRFPEVPETQVEVIDRVDQPPLGAGEAAQGPATAAILNALFDATGVRIRELPVEKALLKHS